MKGIPGKLFSHVQSLKYRQKLILICILVGILPLIVMGVYCYRQTLKLLLNQEYAALDSASGRLHRFPDHPLRGSAEFSLLLRGRGHDAGTGCLRDSGYL